MKLTKEQIEKNIEKSIKEAIKNGYEVVVATDPEGNGYHSLRPDKYPMRYGGTNGKYIALGVWEFVEEIEIFKDTNI